MSARARLRSLFSNLGSWLFLVPFLAAGPASALDDGMLTDVKVDELKQFVLVDDTTEDLDSDDFDHSLVQSRTFMLDNRRYVRYQQFYQGLEVVGRSVVGQYGKDAGRWQHAMGRFHGKLAQDLDVPVYSQYLTDEFRANISDYAQQDFDTRMGITGQVSKVDSQPVIWIKLDKEPVVAYKVSFRVQPEGGRVSWPHYLIAAEDNSIIDFWDNVQALYTDQAPGGNGKTGQYSFGAANMPSFSVSQQGNTCLLGNTLVKVVSLNNGWWVDNNPAPYSYDCDANSGDPANGAWSPENDAYVFSNLVVSMFQNWYNTPVLAQSNGTAKQLLVLVNVGQNYENAFWDGTYLAFGDGANSYYPLVSVSLVGHELSHAFTDSHSDLLYANQSGAINEAFSDMAAIAAEYYLKAFNAESYETIIGTSGIDWNFGDRIAKGNFAMRSLINPSAYSSAECESQVSGCEWTWQQMLKAADQIPLASRQSYIVHKGSGVMNRAFVKIVQALNGDVRRAFALMVRANMLYWTSTATFAEAACGVKQAAQVDGVNTSIVQTAFQQVGVTPGC
ncbi:M4 family metallopeptidase [Parendozoicomonas haliclonae]|uniref:Neutral metalloproteinase n=1 Tax=Parendozoicomonas haliclonae TaxID=1960125 RepID=A0A1X7AKK2_9GAMM|nr:M4 family metallopeptidase [Parendozoicomonas haliclonae]SMA47309.1 Hemagglutinin/proteinase precursor [Parendozoicomonas haliclonae]